MAIKGKVNDIDIVYSLKNAANTLHNQIEDFSRIVKSGADSLGEGWRDNQYNQFMSFIDDLTNNLNSNASVINDAVEYLEYEIKEQ